MASSHKTSTLSLTFALGLGLACTDDAAGDDEIGTDSAETDATGTGDTGSTDTGSTDTTSTDTGSTDTTSTDSGTTTGADEDCPLGETGPYAGPLCGPPDQPCTVHENLALDGPHFRNGTPAIALGEGCQPHLLFSVAEGGYFGFYATRPLGEDWLVEPTPMAVAQGGIAVDPATQIPTVAVDDGAFEVSVWTRDPGWTQDHVFAGQHHVNAGVARGPSGDLHAALHSDVDALRHARRVDAVWSIDELGSGGVFASLALSNLGDAQLAAWTSGGGSWQLQWFAGPGQVESVAAWGAGGLTTGVHDLAIVGDTPHLLHAVAGPDPELPLSVAYSTRLAPDSWTTTIVASDAGVADCTFVTPGEGEVCVYDYVRQRVLAIVTSSGGDVRMLWASVHRLGELVAVCDEGPQGCYWEQGEDTSTGTLWIGWPEGDTVASASLGESFAAAARAAVDPGGRLHVALYDRPPNADSTLRYLRIGD